MHVQGVTHVTEVCRNVKQSFCFLSGSKYKLFQSFTTLTCILVDVKLSLSPESIPCFSIIRASASWQQPFSTSSFWHRSAGSSQRPGSPTWQWQERFGQGSSASAFYVLAGVSNHCYNQDLCSIISLHTLQLPFASSLFGNGVFAIYCVSFWGSSTLRGG